MRTRSASILVCFLLGAMAMGVAQSQRPASPRPSADALARKNFAAALAEYRAQPDSAELRDKVIRLARAVKQAPAIPDEARNYFEQAMAQMQKVVNNEDLKAVAKLFEQAAQAAPWYADAYYNLGGSVGQAARLRERERMARPLYRGAAR